MNVVKMCDGLGSWFEPPLEDHWPDLKKLQWLAAVVKADTGTDITVSVGYYWVNGRQQKDAYSYNILTDSGDSRVGGVYSYREMWVFLTGVQMGAKSHCTIPCCAVD